MEYQKIIQSYEHWLAHREYSPATIQKYTRALTRFFADTGAGKKPTRETVAAWRDSLTAKGYTPLHRQCTAGCGQRLSGIHRQPGGQSQAPQAPAQDLCRPRPGTLPRRVFPSAERSPRHRQQAQPTAAGDHLLHRHSRLGTAIHHGGGCPAAARRPSAARANAARSCCLPSSATA